MKKYIVLIALLIATHLFAQDKSVKTDSIVENTFTTVFEKSNGIKTATYEQTILYYENLAKKYLEIQVKKIGKTDAGTPLHLIIFDASQTFNLKDKTKSTVLINNGIHPGESDGIDASMMLLRDIAESEQLKYSFNDLIICIIPIYNVGGSLNRNSTTRTNQNGPLSYGFRGNALNYDLNRDFIKNDSKNSKAFTQIFHLTNPDIFIDTHVSNGADYQYTLTHLFTQHNKLGHKIGDLLNYKMIPDIEKRMANKGFIISPFVNIYNKTPDQGFSQFMDSPRYSTGYTTLFNTLGLTIETHMLKPYKQRVKGTYELMLSMLKFANDYGGGISKLRENAHTEIKNQKNYPIHWEIDSLNYRTFDFKGYKGEIIKSEITGSTRLKYDRNQPFSKSINYYNHYKPVKEIVIPEYYIVPKNQDKIIERLKLNNILMFPLKKNVAMKVESYFINDYTTSKSPYEGHYLHNNTSVKSVFEHRDFEKGDYLISTNQPGIKYLLETLEPEATDSFFNWNFFDAILQQKEHFSAYVFEDLAIEILEENEELRLNFNIKKETDSTFSKNGYAQLEYIYNHSKHAEKSYLQYPIYRILK
jgi:hypothetical protein